MLTLPYSCNWQKFNSKMNEKRSQEYQSMEPEYVSGQINIHIQELLLRWFYCLIFAPSRTCFSLIKRFPSDHNLFIYTCVNTASSGPIKVNLTIYESLKNNYLKKVFIPWPFLANLNPRAALYEDNGPGIEVGLKLYYFHNFFTCDLCKTFMM